MKALDFLKKHYPIIMATALTISTFILHIIFGNNYKSSTDPYEFVYYVVMTGILVFYAIIILDQDKSKVQYYKFKMLEKEIRDHAYQKGNLGKIINAIKWEFVLLNLLLFGILMIAIFNPELEIYALYPTNFLFIYMLIGFFKKSKGFTDEYFCITKDIEIDEEDYKLYKKKRSNENILKMAVIMGSLWLISFVLGDDKTSPNIDWFLFRIYIGIFSLLLTTLSLVVCSNTFSFISMFTRIPEAKEKIKANDHLKRFLKRFQRRILAHILITICILIPFKTNGYDLWFWIIAYGLTMAQVFDIRKAVKKLKPIIDFATELMEEYVSKGEKVSLTVLYGLRKDPYCEDDPNYPKEASA